MILLSALEIVRFDPNIVFYPFQDRSLSTVLSTVRIMFGFFKKWCLSGRTETELSGVHSASVSDPEKYLEPGAADGVNNTIVE